MNKLQHIGTYLLICAFGFLSLPFLALAQTPPASSAPQHTGVEPDGQHDFDFEIGTWKIHLSPAPGSVGRLHDLEGPIRRHHGLAEKSGTVAPISAGIRNRQPRPTGHIEGLTLRVYNPQTRQWSIYWANSKDPALGQPIQPMVGEFKNGRGEFYDQELWKGRSAYVRFIWSNITPNSAHFEQSYSEDGGKTWEVNWITDQTRVPDKADNTH